ncbi:hypothetical protein COCNU_scaffold006919G000060 [Cocos nucifera]|nr:hypothetical protein [Cocos nucifera]
MFRFRFYMRSGEEGSSVVRSSNFSPKHMMNSRRKKAYRKLSVTTTTPPSASASALSLLKSIWRIQPRIGDI